MSYDVNEDTTMDGKSVGPVTTTAQGSMREREIKKSVLGKVREIDLMSLMGMNRHARRALAKANHVKKIGGSMKPIRNENKNRKQDSQG